MNCAPFQKLLCASARASSVLPSASASLRMTEKFTRSRRESQCTCAATTATVVGSSPSRRRLMKKYSLKMPEHASAFDLSPVPSSPSFFQERCRAAVAPLYPSPRTKSFKYLLITLTMRSHVTAAQTADLTFEKARVVHIATAFFSRNQGMRAHATRSLNSGPVNADRVKPKTHSSGI